MNGRTSSSPAPGRQLSPPLVARHCRDRRGSAEPTVWTEEKLRAAAAMYKSGEHDVATIARVMGVSRASVYRGLAVAQLDSASEESSDG